MNDLDRRTDPPTPEDLADGFDAFYKETRDRLLLQTFALTGDLNASRSAVRDAFVVAWHHWRKLSRSELAEAQVRPRAWRNASRRTTAKPWGRSKNLDATSRATLAALSALTHRQRSALILTQLAAVNLPDMAREIGLPVESAERELQAGAARFATQPDVPEDVSIHTALAGLARVTESASWPRATIIRRAGAARHRAHTVVGVTAALTVFLGAGVAVGDAAGVRPTLDRAPLPEAASSQAPTAQVQLPDTALLTQEDVQAGLAGRPWTQGRTSDNSTGNGLVHHCQGSRYADPRGVAAWARIFRLTDTPRRFAQTAEASTNRRAAHRAYQRALGWFSACIPPDGTDVTKLPHTQLLSTAESADLGDEAAVFLLQATEPTAAHLVGVARTGSFVTITSMDTDVPAARADRQGVTNLLGTAVNRLCDLADGGKCAPSAPRLDDVSPYPVPRSSALLSTIDLPPVGAEYGFLVGTAARQVTANRGQARVLGCNTVTLQRSYDGARVKHNVFRNFVFVEGDLPTTVGLTQVAGSLPPARAQGFVAQLRRQIAACPESDASAGTEVTELVREDDAGSSLTAWRMETALPGDNSVQYDVAVVRVGTAVAELIYVGADGAQMTDADFVALARRASERLDGMPRYR
ncbi:hypothetical protein FXB39_05750 [Nocardioides sp. BGMRC 2183]|nr:hypothetical protein FXB39_05750 [Nocardioides sp. BGMRC 2183]